MDQLNKNEIIEEQVVNDDEGVKETEIPAESVCTEKKKCKCHVWNIIVLSVLTAAVAGLYVLHFIAPKEEPFTPTPITDEPGTGEVIYVNFDTINEKYELVDILSEDINNEKNKQEALFANKEKSFQQKTMQYQQNVQSGILTQVQMQNAEQQLQAEYEQLQSQKEQVYMDLQARQSAALMQIYDSIQSVVKKINSKRNASFVLIYQEASPIMVHADPTKDITEQVLFELNKHFKKE